MWANMYSVNECMMLNVQYLKIIGEIMTDNNFVFQDWLKFNFVILSILFNGILF